MPSSPESTAAPKDQAQDAAPVAAPAPKRSRKWKKEMKGAKLALASGDELRKEAIDDEVVVKFEHVTKTYYLYKNDRQRVVGTFFPGRRSTRTINANDDISFEIKRGEAVAFFGLNGAGKSTALKMASGVAFPTSGEITVNGRVCALLELRAGFDNRLTGRENIRLRGKILGLTDEELKEIEPEVIKFADIGDYIDQPMRSYSSGMKARVGFGLSVSLKPEILIVDEALSVGDRRFKKKCVQRIREVMSDENVTVLFVTHSTSTAREFCSRGIVLHHGKKLYDGPFKKAVAYYSENVLQEPKKQVERVEQLEEQIEEVLEEEED